METVKDTAECAEHLIETAKSAERPFPMSVTSSSIVSSLKRPGFAPDFQFLMLVRTHLDFACCAADALSASIKEPFPADAPFFRRGIPVLKIDFQEQKPHVYGLDSVQWIHSNLRSPFGTKSNVRQRHTGSGMAATTDCQLAAHRRSSSEASAKMLFS